MFHPISSMSVQDSGNKYWELHIWARGYFMSIKRIKSNSIQIFQEQVEFQMSDEQLTLWRDNSE